MIRAIQDATGCREALTRLPKLGLRELRQHWRVLYKAQASPHLSRELLLRAVAYRMQEVALGGLRPVRQRYQEPFYSLKLEASLARALVELDPR
jgi:hypothetical protein